MCDKCKLDAITRRGKSLKWNLVMGRSLIRGFEVDVYLIPKGGVLEDRWLEGSFVKKPDKCECKKMVDVA